MDALQRNRRVQEERGDGMSDVIKIILIALVCPLVLPVVIDEAEGSETE